MQAGILLYVLQYIELPPPTHNYFPQNFTRAEVETSHSGVIVYVFPILRAALSFIFITPMQFFPGAQKVSVK